jgi:hypothetical protein
MKLIDESARRTMKMCSVSLPCVSPEAESIDKSKPNVNSGLNKSGGKGKSLKAIKVEQKANRMRIA